MSAYLLREVLLRLLPHEFVFDHEGGKEADTHAGGDDKPEVDVVLGVDIEEIVAEGAEADAEEDAAPTEATVFVVLLLLLLDEDFCGFGIGSCLNEGEAQLGITLFLLDVTYDAHHDSDDGDGEGKDYGKYTS